MSEHDSPSAPCSLFLLGPQAAVVATGLGDRVTSSSLASAPRCKVLPGRLVAAGTPSGPLGWLVTFSPPIGYSKAISNSPLLAGLSCEVLLPEDVEGPRASRIVPDALALCTFPNDAGASRLGEQLRQWPLPHSSLHGDLIVQISQGLLLARHLAQQKGWTWPEWTDLRAPRPRWQGVCEKCSDPDCEHRLFSDLMKPVGQQADTGR